MRHQTMFAWQKRSRLGRNRQLVQPLFAVGFEQRVANGIRKHGTGGSVRRAQLPVCRRATIADLDKPDGPPFLGLETRQRKQEMNRPRECTRSGLVERSNRIHR